MGERQMHTVTCLVTYEVNCRDALAAQIEAIYMAHGCQQVLGSTVVLPSKNAVRCVAVEFSKTAGSKVDDNELLTHEWLTSIGFTLSEYKARDGYGWFQMGLLSYYYVPPSYTAILISIVSKPLEHIKTRGQLRSLISNLTDKESQS